MGGYHFIYSLYQQELKTEMKTYLSANRASEFGTIFEFTLNNNKVVDSGFTWEEENVEFRFNQDLYDIVHIEKKEGKLLVTCLKDNDENQLEKQINEIHKNNKPFNSKTAQQTVKFFSSFYLPNQDRKFDTKELKEVFKTRYLMLLNSSFSKIQLPPPRC